MVIGVHGVKTIEFDLFLSVNHSRLCLRLYSSVCVCVCVAKDLSPCLSQARSSGQINIHRDNEFDSYSARSDKSARRPRPAKRKRPSSPGDDLTKKRKHQFQSSTRLSGARLDNGDEKPQRRMRNKLSQKPLSSISTLVTASRLLSKLSPTPL